MDETDPVLWDITTADEERLKERLASSTGATSPRIAPYSHRAHRAWRRYEGRAKRASSAVADGGGGGAPSKGAAGGWPATFLEVRGAGPKESHCPLDQLSLAQLT